MRCLLLGAALLLAGCTVTGLMAAAVVVGAEHDSARQAAPGNLAPRDPEMAPERKVSEQDCSKPIDFTLGNIRCK